MKQTLIPLIQEAARELLEQSLSFRYDICTCQKCREAMLSRIVEQVCALDIPFPEEALPAVKDAYSKDIGRALFGAVEAVNAKPPHLVTEDRKKDFKRLLEKISGERGLDLRNYHTELLKRRIALRLQKNNIPSYAAYIGFLEKRPQEFDRLFETLCINVSEFMRDPPVWVTVGYLFENLLRTRAGAGREIRVWSAGCACGEEPYSIAITAAEALRAIGAQQKMSILATDIDKACMNAADKAVYAKESLKNMENKLLARYFDTDEAGFRVKEDIRGMVRFEYLDLTSQEYPRDIDVIFCRNVFIYFNRDLQRQILGKFFASLRPGGYVVMGKSEAMANDALAFEVVDINARIFRKAARPA